MFGVFLIVACWSVKGGVGTSVIAASLALVMAADSVETVTLVDLAGDQVALLGLPAAPPQGLAEFLSSNAADEALTRISSPVADRLRLVARGHRAEIEPLPSSNATRLVSAMSAMPGDVVVDCGSWGDPLALDIANVASHSLLVLRGCYLALRKAAACPTRPSSVILVREEGRALGAAEIEDVLGVPVSAEVAWEPRIARAVDAGLLASRLPRNLERALRSAA